MITEFLVSPCGVAIVIFAGCYLTTIVDSCNKSFAAEEKHRAEAELKRVLAERGMSAAEILELVSVNPSGRTKGDSRNERTEQLVAPLPPYKTPTMSI